jgi:hypothetical protein
MVKVGKTSWPAKILAVKEDGSMYLIRYDGVKKDRDTWHSARDVELVDDVGRRSRLRPHHFTY